MMNDDDDDKGVNQLTRRCEGKKDIRKDGGHIRDWEWKGEEEE
jgi:hypothetical protein